jgi:hypothetical protein
LQAKHQSSLGVVGNDGDDIIFDRRIVAVSFNSNCEDNNLKYFRTFDLGAAIQ